MKAATRAWVSFIVGPGASLELVFLLDVTSGCVAVLGALTAVVGVTLVGVDDTVDVDVVCGWRVDVVVVVVVVAVAGVAVGVGGAAIEVLDLSSFLFFSAVACSLVVLDFGNGGGRVIIRTTNFFSSNLYSVSLFSSARILPL